MCGCNIPRSFKYVDYDYSNQAAERVAKSLSPQPVVCPHCYEMIKTEFAWCPFCGRALRDHACRYCHQKVEVSEDTCKFCGAPV